MKRHKQRQHALALIYMHLMNDQSFDELFDSIRERAHVDAFTFRVLDTESNALPKVHLKLENFTTGEVYESVTNKDGNAVFSDVINGNYRLSVLGNATPVSLNQTVFGIEDAVVQPVEKDETVNNIKPKIKTLRINQILDDITILSIDDITNSELRYIVSVLTFMPYLYVDDEFMSILYQIEERLEIYETVINHHLKQSWRFERLGLLEQAILLLSCAELEFADVDKVVIVNEAVELAKEFCDSDSYKLINGVLDAL